MIRPSFKCVFVSFLVFFLTMTPGCTRSSEKEKEKGVGVTVARVGDRVVGFKIKTFDGPEFDLASTSGRPVVINFWASWCGPCRLEGETMQKLYLAFKDRGVVFVGVAVQDDAEASRKYIKRFGWTFPAGPDETDGIRQAYNVFGIPRTFVVGRDGIVSYMRSGAVTERELIREIKKIL